MTQPPSDPAKNNSDNIDIIEATALDADQRSAVASMVLEAPGSAANPPLNEQGLLNLHATQGVRHLLAVRGAQVVGYAQLIASGADEVGAELVTAADAEPSVADRLLRQARASAHGKAFRLWAHGEQSVAARAAQTAGLTPVRSLLQFRRRVDADPLPAIPLPAGVVIRSFVPGQDDAAWLRVNARAFASHPEQGKWTQHDLDERLAADWFDPTGFLLADRDGEILGYHWTKVHAELDPPIGEVYVIGVDPAAQGLRLGRPLLNAGLNYLTGRGVPAVLLYVESDNARAVGLYESSGFTIFSTDTQYGQ